MRAPPAVASGSVYENVTGSLNFTVPLNPTQAYGLLVYNPSKTSTINYTAEVTAYSRDSPGLIFQSLKSVCMHTAPIFCKIL